MLLTGSGIELEKVYDLPLDVFNLYVDTALRLEARGRLGYISDTSASVGGLFGGKTKGYVEVLEKQSTGEAHGRPKTNRSD